MEDDRAFADNLLGKNTKQDKDIESEKALLSLCLRHEKAVLEVAGKRVTRTDFSDSRNAFIFQAISDLFLENTKVDRISVGEKLIRQGNLTKAGDYSYIYEVADTVAVISNLEQYISYVKEKSQLRNVSKKLTELQAKTLNGVNSGNDIIDIAVTDLSSLRSDDDSGVGFEDADKVLKQVMFNVMEGMNGKGANAGIKSGFRLFDSMTGGFKKGTLNILAARPGMGKSALAINIATNVARNRIPVAIFSLEMSKVEIGNRILSSVAGINSRHLQQARLTDEEQNKIARGLKELSGIPLYIDDNSSVNPTTMNAKLKELKASGRLGLVILDYLQLMTMPGKGNISRQQEISDISRSLKVMAKEMQVPIIALSQLSRAAGQREDHTPQLTDLRDSGAIEQDADTVIFIDRADYYKKSDATDEEQGAPDTPQKDAYIYLSKNRQGEVGRVKVKWWGERTLFYEEHNSDPVEPNSGNSGHQSSYTRTVPSGQAASDYKFDDNPVPPPEDPPFVPDIPSAPVAPYDPTDDGNGGGDPGEASSNQANEDFFSGSNDDYPPGFMD